MHIKFISRGKGKGSTATNYIMSDKDHNKKTRPVEPVVLRGNPVVTGALSDSLDFEHKYRSGVIAFHPNDNPSGEQIEEVLTEFEKIAFAGLEPDQYDFCAVLHKEEESEHIHIIVPRVELSSGKSMNIASPGWKNTYDPLRDLFNEKYKWVSPDISLNPEISRITQPGETGTHKSKLAQTRAEIKKSIEQYIIDEIDQGNVQNRDDIKLTLMSLGFEIPRAGKDYITVLDTETNTRIRFKGAIYEQHWTVERTLEETSNQEAERDGESNKGRIRELERELENRISERAEYNISRYSYPKQTVKQKSKPEPGGNKKDEKSFDGGMDTAASDSPSDLYSYFREQLGSDGIFDAPHPGPIISDQSEQSKNKQSGGEAESNQLEQMRWSVVRRDRRERSRIPEWLQNFKDKIKNIYDRTRTAIDEGFGKIINEIRSGYESVTVTSNDLDEANTVINQAIQQSSSVIERGVKRVRENRNDELERFKSQINLVEYAASEGYSIVKRDSSKNSKAMKHPSGDKIIVATKMDGHGVYFSASHGDSGSIIDFVQNRENLNLGQTRKKLRAFGGFTNIKDYKNYSKPLKSSKDTAQAAFVLAQSDVTDEHPYLINERKISKEILKDNRFNRSVKIDSRNNAIFPHFNGSGVAGYEIKNKNFTGYAKGGEKGLWYSSNITRADRVVIVESGIDALSHAELKETGEETAYVSIAGSMSELQLELIRTVINGREAVIATDNDKNGNYYASQITELSVKASREIADNKDWNDDLKDLKELYQEKGLENI